MYHDPFTGKYHTHYREYDPVHARWLSEDPAGYVDGLSLYNAYMGVNGIDPLGLEISKREMMEAYSDIFGYDDILLRAFIASGHSFDMGDVLGDWDVDRSWFTKGQPLDIEIEEDLDAVTAAFYLRKAFFQALGDSREMRKNVLSMKYGSNDPGAFKGSDSYFRAGEWAAELKQLEAIAAANMSVDAAAMAEAYFSIPAIMSEGADFVSTVAEVCNGNYYALAGLLPFVPSTVKMVDNFKGSVDNLIPSNAIRRGVDPAHHNANVAIRDAQGKLIRHERLISGNMTPAEKAMGFPKGQLASHTEARAVTRIPLQSSQSMIITGQRPPCPSCKGYMNRAAQNSGAKIRYRWREGGITNNWTTNINP